MEQDKEKVSGYTEKVRFMMIAGQKVVEKNTTTKTGGIEFKVRLFRGGQR